MPELYSAAARSADEAAAQALGHRGDAIAHLELAVAALEVLLDGRRADDEPVGDPLGAVAVRGQLEDLELARCQPRAGRVHRADLARGDQVPAVGEVARRAELDRDARAVRTQHLRRAVHDP